jgi:Fe-S oxidoreductase
MSAELFFRLLGFFLVFAAVVFLSLALRERFAHYRVRGFRPRLVPPDTGTIQAARVEMDRRAGRDRFALLAHGGMLVGAVAGLPAHVFFILGRLPFPAAPVLAAIGLVVFLGACLLMAGGALAALARRLFFRPRLSFSLREIAPHLSLLLLAATGLVYGGVLADGMDGAPLFAARFAHVASLALFVFLIGRTTLLHLVLSRQLERTGFRPVTGALPPDEAVARLADPPGGAAAETIGLAGVEGLSGGELLRLDACVGCGFCDAACPATRTGKTLSPRRIIDLVRRAESGRSRPLSGTHELETMTDECSLCYACDAACPLFVERADKIVRLRRYQVLEQGRAPAAWKKALANAERHGGVFGDTGNTRRKLVADLGLPYFRKGMKADYILWMGCYSVWDPNVKGTLAALIRLLAANARSAAVLEHEPCCGDLPRRLGDEYRFRELALKNIELLRDLGGARLLNACPHCAHSFKKEYPALGGRIDAVHYLEVLDELTPSPVKAPASARRRAVYHDSCYLGRLSGLYEAPRRVLVGRVELVALPDEKEHSLCCGGGGGRILLEEENGQRASLLKAREALAQGADLLVTSCPYCLSLYRDAAATLDGKIEVRDLLEVVSGGAAAREY